MAALSTMSASAAPGHADMLTWMFLRAMAFLSLLLFLIHRILHH